MARVKIYGEKGSFVMAELAAKGDRGADVRSPLYDEKTGKRDDGSLAELREKGNRARVADVPQNGELNIDDIIEFYSNAFREVIVPDPAKPGASKIDRVPLEEPRHSVARILSRKWPRRTSVRCKPEDIVTMSVELKKLQWPTKQLEGGFFLVAHPAGTFVSGVAKQANIKLLQADLELQEAEEVGATERGAPQ